MKTLQILTILFLCSSCSALPLGSKKEERRMNRASKKLEKLTMRFPELTNTDTLTLPFTLVTPENRGIITRPLILPEERELTDQLIPSGINPFEIPFSDQYLDALFIYDGGNFILDYSIKPTQIDTSIKAPVQTIQPVKYVERSQTKWQSLIYHLGILFFIITFTAGIFMLYYLRKLFIK